METREPTPPGETPAGPRCSGCGEELHLTGKEERCLRCGLPVTVSLSADDVPAAIDEQGVLHHDATCRRCGYNLRGLRRDGLCPECAAPISVSLREDLLCFAEPDYVRKLARGNRWVLLGLTIVVLSWVLMILVTIALRIGPSPRGSIADRVMAVVMVFAGWGTIGGTIGGALLFLCGVWLVTVGEPSVYDTRRRDTARRLVRISLLVGLLGLPLNWIVSELVPPPRLRAVFALFSLCFWVPVVVGVAAYFRYLRGVAERIPDRQAAELAGSLSWTLAVVIGVLVLVSAVGTVARWAPVLVQPASPTATAPAGTPVTPASARFASIWWISSIKTCVTVPAGMAALVLFFLGIRLHSRLKKPLIQQAALASRHWSAAAAVPSILAPKTSDLKNE